MSGLRGWIARAVKALRRRTDPHPAALAALRGRLRWVASALAGEPLEVREIRDGIGGVEGTTLFLPPSLAVFEEDEAAAYLYRVAYSITARRLAPPCPPRDASQAERLLRTWLAVPMTTAALEASLPGCIALVGGLRARERARRPLPSALPPRMAALESLARALLGERVLPTHPGARAWFEEAAARAGAGELGEAARLLDGWEALPGRASDTPAPVLLWGMLGPLAGTREDAVGRSTRPGVRSFIASGESPAADGTLLEREAARPRVHRYDEWDERRRAYRLDWCTLSEQRPARAAAGLAPPVRIGRVLAERRKEIRALRAAFSRVAQRREWRGSQRDGPEVDLDALVDRHTLLRSGHTPPEKLYAARRRARSDLAVLVLLDASLSTASLVGREPVIDVVRDSVLVLGEAVAGIHERLAIAAFSSITRNDCRFLLLKGFEDPWAHARPGLAGLTPDGATRIGPALRHATHLLRGTRARRKLLLLIGDCEPMDYDGYEGAYAVADVRMALQEARRSGLHLFALSVAEEGRAHLPRMLGPGSYAVLPHAGQLTLRLARVYRELLRG